MTPNRGLEKELASVRVAVSSQPSAFSRISRPRELVIANRELILTWNSHDVTSHATLSDWAATIRP